MYTRPRSLPLQRKTHPHTHTHNINSCATTQMDSADATALMQTLLLRTLTYMRCKCKLYAAATMACSTPKTHNDWAMLWVWIQLL
jgi:hypothetical protein